ncbi:hypothetical protein RAM_44780 [Amycolatopsis mediterranei S699]|uniref:Uncharacterized protein n=1 Tax=Amycolatopsis mediterranei (strain S699) TaxID=713604 RepID=A0A9R0P6V2_AMYMS|nr:hypothetical protein RAM_44780 [Amycolatopsis mediterranei S699]
MAGNKAGNWKGWYELNISVAEQRFRDHLRAGEED